MRRPLDGIGDRRDYLEPYPSTVTPVPASLMLAPAVTMRISFTPAPTVGIDPHTELGTVDVSFSNMPAIAVFVANDFR
jgi:hypothetical protein